MKNIAVNKNNQKIVNEFLKLIQLIEIENSIISDKKKYNINIFRILNLKKNLNCI